MPKPGCVSTVFVSGPKWSIFSHNTPIVSYCHWYFYFYLPCLEIVISYSLPWICEHCLYYCTKMANILTQHSPIELFSLIFFIIYHAWKYIFHIHYPGYVSLLVDQNSKYFHTTSPFKLFFVIFFWHWYTLPGNGYLRGTSLDV